MKNMAAATIALLCAWAAPSSASDYARLSTEALIDELQNLDSRAPGIDSSAIYDGFIADDGSVHFVQGLIPNSQPAIPPQMRELVRRGISALPILIDHLNDNRPTRVSVGKSESTVFGGQFFNYEYDPKDRNTRTSGCIINCRYFEGQYVVKVGDVCEVLIGQIVNRRLYAVRYQPTAILIVNSPIETSSLAKRIREDWGNLDARELSDSLVSDLRTSRNSNDAEAVLRRLRFYFPKTYAALEGDDLVKRKEFEADEATQRSTIPQ